MILLKLLILSLSLAQSLCFTYTLPSDKGWPTTAQFLELRTSVAGKVMFKGDNDYNPHTWNLITNTPKPAAIVQPSSTQDVIAALRFAQKYNIRVSVQSTGHHQDHRNIYDNSVHIDMCTMNAKSIDLTKKTLTLGPGNNFSQIQKYVATQTNQRLVALGGADPGVGIYGWTVGGGHGFLTRQYGLGVDALLSIDLVLANLTVITASSEQNQDLFRALRGSGGGAYGIAVSLTVKLFDDPGKISTFTGLYELNSHTAKMFAQWMISAPNQAAAYFLPRYFDTQSVIIAAICSSNATFCSSALATLQIGCIAYADFQITCQPKLDAFSSFYNYFSTSVSELGTVTYIASTALNAGNIVAGLQDIVAYIKNNQYTGCSGNAVLGGASSTIDSDQSQTSVSAELRQSLMAITCFSAFDTSSSIAIKQSQVTTMTNLAENIYKKYSMMVYWNEPMHDFPKDDWRERYWGGMTNYNSLLVVKNKYDPKNMLSCYHCVGYVRVDNEDPSVCPLINCTCSNTPNGQCNAVSSTNSILNLIKGFFSSVYSFASNILHLILNIFG